MEPGLELARCPDTALARQTDLRAEAICGAGLIALIIVPFVMALLPLPSVLWLTGLCASFAALGALPWPRKPPPNVDPEDIFDPVLRDTYREIQCARGAIGRALDDTPTLASVARSLNERCSDAVRSSARIALLGNRLHGYLSANSEARIRQVAAQLRTKASGARDASIAHDLERAAAAYDRQLAIYDQLAQRRDRIRARLDLVLASLQSFTAAVVRHQTAEDEQLALADESLTEQVDDIREELAAIEAALEIDLAA